jgi:phage-related protein
MTRKIIFYESHFIDFYRNLDIKVKLKIQYVFELIKQVDHVPSKFLKQIIGIQGLYEIRVNYQSNTFRVFCCFDEGQLVVLFNAFQKKDIKIPKKEIEKAERLMKEYFQNK